MKKVGIVTIHKARNYGAFLQAFSLQKYISKNYDCSIIDYENKNIKSSYNIVKFKNVKSFLKSLIYIFKNLKRKESFEKCIKKYMNLTTVNEKYDVVVAGSDQIWNIKLTNGYDKMYSLEYFNVPRKISYASSVGQESLILKNSDIYAKILNNIQNISVREESAKAELEKITNKKIEVMLDPTFLLSKEEWDKFEIENDINEDYIFSYFVAVTKQNYEALEKLSNKLKTKTISYSEHVKEANVLKDCYLDDPIKFINRLKHSKLVFTSSFHGTVFSLIFNKEFYVMPPEGKANRIINLLEKLGLTSRIINSVDQIEKIDFNKKIDYKEVNKKMEELRKKSQMWLDRTLEE